MKRRAALQALMMMAGAHEEGVWSLEPNLEAKQRILAQQARFFGQMK